MKTDYIQIRIAPDVKEKIKILAAKDGRNMSNYIERLLRIDIERHAFELKENMPSIYD